MFVVFIALVRSDALSDALNNLNNAKSAFLSKSMEYSNYYAGKERDLMCFATKTKQNNKTNQNQNSGTKLPAATSQQNGADHSDS
jgi:hypothetical protein